MISVHSLLGLGLKGMAQTLTLVLLCSTAVFGIRIDTELRVTPGLWDEHHHREVWTRVVGRIQNLVSVATMHNSPPSLPPGSYCGPRFNDVVSNRHINENALSMETSDTMIVYIYTDTMGISLFFVTLFF